MAFSMASLSLYFDKGIMLIIVIGIGLLIGLVGFGLTYYLRHKVIIRVHKKTASKTLIVNTFRARLVRDKSMSRIKPMNPFIKWMANIKPPNNPYTWYIQGSSMVLNVYQRSEGIYQYITFTTKTNNNEPTYMLIDEDLRLWTALQLKETAEKYKKQGFIEKYGQVISIGIVAVFFIITLILVIRWADGIVPKILATQKELGLAIINQTRG